MICIVWVKIIQPKKSQGKKAIDRWASGFVFQFVACSVTKNNYACALPFNIPGKTICLDGVLPTGCEINQKPSKRARTSFTSDQLQVNKTTTLAVQYVTHNEMRLVLKCTDFALPDSDSAGTISVFVACRLCRLSLLRTITQMHRHFRGLLNRLGLADASFRLHFFSNF